MIVLFDTSTLTAAMVQSHPHHAWAIPWLDRAQARAFDFVVAAHSLAELYASLMSMPVKPRIDAATALQMIDDNVIAHAQIRALGTDDYFQVLTWLAGSQLIGGVVYDALIAAVAEIANVDYLLTFNISDFQRVWSQQAHRIISPLTTTSP